MHKLKFFYALVCLTLVITGLGACERTKNTTLLTTPATLDAALPAGKTLSGSYLAGRFAQHQQDWDAAQSYMNTVLHHDADNILLRERAFLLSLGAGNYSAAKEMANNLVPAVSAKESAQGNNLALVFLVCDALRDNNYNQALLYLGRLPAEGLGQYTKPLLTAWTLAGQGKKAEALKTLEGSTAPDDLTYHMHAGMIEEMTGDTVAAEKHYKNVVERGLTLHSALMIANFYERHERTDMANAIYSALEKTYPFSPAAKEISGTKATNLSGKNASLPQHVIRPAEGAAIALFDIATLLYEKHAYDSTQIYTSLVRFLQPESPLAKLMMGDLAALQTHYTKAVEQYQTIGKTSPVYWMAQMRIAEVYEADGQIEQAVTQLKSLTLLPQTRLQSLLAMGDLYRRHDRFENAVTAYNQALEGVTEYRAGHWTTLYARGMALEKLNQWDKAEKDLLTALNLQPNNPEILNFIGYSWANKGVHLDKALEYTKRAAAQKPDDGYILDSYGWTLFRTAHYQDAVRQLEQAVTLVPNDSTILDHLGDAYWQAGRENEARFQWKRATDLSSDHSFKDSILQKIQHGIAIVPLTARKEANL